jgi:hypothetical protein
MRRNSDEQLAEQVEGQKEWMHQKGIPLKSTAEEEVETPQPDPPNDTENGMNTPPPPAL